MEANQHIFSPQRGTSGGSGGMTCNYVFPHSDLSLKPTELEYLVEIMLETETLKYVVDIYLLVYNLCWATKMLRCIHCQIFQLRILLVFSSHFSGSLLGERIYVSLAHRHHIYLGLSLVVQVREGACRGLQRLTARSMFNIIYLLRNIFCAPPRTRWGRTSPRTPAWWGTCPRRGSGSRPQIWREKLLTGKNWG